MTAVVVPVYCPNCKREIDPEVCYCGEYVNDHGGVYGHNPVPMGCGCPYGEGDEDGS